MEKREDNFREITDEELAELETIDWTRTEAEQMRDELLRLQYMGLRR